MGTPQVPESKPDQALVDVPRMGSVMWILLAALLIPPAAVTFLGSLLFPLPHQQLWVILLGCPIPLIVLSLPRKYLIRTGEIQIVGFYYRRSIPISDIRSIEPIGTLRALLHPGSLYCTDPAKALMLSRKKGRSLVISPIDPRPFVNLLTGSRGAP